MGQKTSDSITLVILKGDHFYSLNWIEKQQINKAHLGVSQDVA